jgi:TM2 domain-containing membrane protein YozV
MTAPPPVPAYRQVQPKNPALHGLVSAVVTGLGTMLNGEFSKGLVLMGTTYVTAFGVWLLTFVFIGWLLVWVPFLLWVYGIWDAYRGAQRWNAMHGIIS